MDQLMSMPDLIRRVALTILVEYHPDGIQQVHLRKLVEEQFSPFIDINEKSNSDRFRNTLSTLDSRYSYYVIKENLSHKNVILKPTIELIYDIDEIKPPELNDYFSNYVEEPKKEKEESNTQNITKINKKFLFSYIDIKYPDRFENSKRTLKEIKSIIKESDFYKIVQEVKNREDVFIAYFQGLQSEEVSLSEEDLRNATDLFILVNQLSIGDKEKG